MGKEIVRDDFGAEAVGGAPIGLGWNGRRKNENAIGFFLTVHADQKTAILAIAAAEGLPDALMPIIGVADAKQPDGVLVGDENLSEMQRGRGNGGSGDGDCAHGMEGLAVGV